MNDDFFERSWRDHSNHFPSASLFPRFLGWMGLTLVSEAFIYWILLSVFNAEGLKELEFSRSFLEVISWVFLSGVIVIPLFLLFLSWGYIRGRSKGQSEKEQDLHHLYCIRDNLIHQKQEAVDLKQRLEKGEVSAQEAIEEVRFLRDKIIRLLSKFSP